VILFVLFSIDNATISKLAVYSFELQFQAVALIFGLWFYGLLDN